MYFDQLMFSGVKSDPCHPAYHVVATISSRSFELLDPEEPEEVVPTIGGLAVAAEEDDITDAGAVDEHMGVAHTGTKGREARRDRGRNIMETTRAEEYSWRVEL